MIVKSVQITHATFDDPHPNPDHFRNVIYDPRWKTVTLDGKQPGRMYGGLGDWIVHDEVDDTLRVVSDNLFRYYYREVQ